MKAYGYLLAVLVLSTGPAMAAPVTLRFEAEVFDVYRSPSSQIAIEVESGDTMVGQLTFEPFSLPPLDNPFETQEALASQSHTASLHLGELDFVSPESPLGLVLLATNNGANVIFPDGSGTQVDEIEFSGLLNPVNPPTLSGDLSAEFQFRLWGPVTLLDAAGVPGEVDVLNDFDVLRNLQLQIANSSGERLVVTAVVGNFTSVPEPSTLTVVIAAVLCCGMAASCSAFGRVMSWKSPRV